MKRILVTFLCIVMLSTLVAACAEGERPLTVDELLSLGEQFLLDGNYEQALIQFIQVIEVEPMNPRGYTGAAEAYVGLGQHERAMEILEEGQRVVGDDAGIRGMLDGILRAEEARRQAEEARRLAEAEAEIRQELEDLLALYEVGGYESIIEMMQQGTIMDSLWGIEEFPFILLNDADDYGIGIYHDDQWGHFIYIGEFLNNQRNGHGTWVGIGGSLRFLGEWMNDIPNGNGTLHFAGTTSVGILVNGLWNGSVAYSSFDGLSFSLNFVNGQLIALDEFGLVYDGTPHVWMSIDGLRGVKPFAESVV